MDFFRETHIQGGSPSSIRISCDSIFDRMASRGTADVQPHEGTAGLAPHQSAAAEMASRTTPPDRLTNNNAGANR